MRFGIPKYRLPRDVLEAEMQRVVDLGSRSTEQQGREHPEDTMQAGKFDAAFLAVGAHIGKRAMIPAGDAQNHRCHFRCCAAWKAKTSHCSAARRRLRRRQHGHRRGAHRQSAWAAEPLIVYRRTREKMPAHDFEVEEALQEGMMVKWLSTIKKADRSSLTIEKMAPRQQWLSAANRRIRNASRPTRWLLALGRMSISDCRGRSRASRSATAWCRSAPT